MKSKRPQLKKLHQLLEDLYPLAVYSQLISQEEFGVNFLKERRQHRHWTREFTIQDLKGAKRNKFCARASTITLNLASDPKPQTGNLQRKQVNLCQAKLVNQSLVRISVFCRNLILVTNLK